MAKRYNPNLAKIHFTYSVNEVAELFSVHSHTVREWIKKGLPVMNETRPVLIQGAILREFISEQNKKQKRPCAENEMYCVSCREPKIPLGDMVDYEPRDEQKGCLVGLCPSCESSMNRFASLSSIERISKKLEVNIRPIKNT